MGGGAWEVGHERRGVTIRKSRAREHKAIYQGGERGHTTHRSVETSRCVQTGTRAPVERGAWHRRFQ